MGTFSKGEIVLFPFPYTNLQNRKLRPCLVISDEMGNDLILCQITSQFSRKDDFTIELKKDESLNGTLNLDSYIRCNMIFTASKNQIIKSLCKLSNKKYKTVIQRILEVIK